MLSSIAAFIGRVLIALIFILSGANKLFSVDATERMIVSAGLPGGLAVPTGLFEVILGLALVFGFMVRLSSILLAGFTFLTILFFHRNFTDPAQAFTALKNLAIIGGLLCLFADRQRAWGYDALRHRRRADVADAESRARSAEAELRAERRDATVVPRADDRLVL